MGLDTFTYDPDHRVVVCRACGTCLAAKATGWRRHLRADPHRMKGDELKATVELMSSYSLRPAEELRRWRPERTRPCRAIDGLRVYAGYRCACAADCDFCTIRLAAMHDHMPRHGKKASQHGRGGMALWHPCRLQTYFTAKGLIDYFVVESATGPWTADESAAAPGTSTQAPPPRKEETRLFEGLKEDLKTAVRDLDERAARVEDTGDSRADRESWLLRTGFPYLYL
ncbi:hypothetical protein HIM_11225 [Hirsutella minnesotensis 3608]|uniref:Uncharacterized protein n=1 Tax=Hirsutella minnesotensis 3608 TaxID=1043627 RepID=A0A0F7ZFM2_9HYPO|nr:hypothetical protein HIM_11225 [Hirsutella minnesotensis 3608]